MELHHAPVTFGLIVRDEAPRRALAFARMPIDSSKAFAARQIDARADKFESEGRRSFDWFIRFALPDASGRHKTLDQIIAPRVVET